MLFMDFFVKEIVKFYQFFRILLLQIHLGSGAIRIRNDVGCEFTQFSFGTEKCVIISKDKNILFGPV
jgi:hypothetical protein